MSKAIEKEMNHELPIVNTGFLELAEPLIPDAIENRISQGATDICVVSYFLSAGRHIQEVVPAEVYKAKQSNINIPMQILPHISG